MTIAPELVQLQQSTRRLVDELLTTENEFHQSSEVPAVVSQRLKEAGYYGLCIPEQFGGSGIGTLGSTLVQCELARLPPQFWTMLRSAVGPSVKPLIGFGSEAQKERWLPRIADGSCGVGIAMTEAHAGSDVSSIRTTAVRHGDRYVVNGTKMFISNADRVDLFTLFAYTDRSAGVMGGISAFLLERGTPGLTVSKPIPTMGLTLNGVFELSLDGVELPASSLLGEEGKGFTYFFKSLNEGRLNVGAQAVGAGTLALEESIAYAQQRQAFGHPIADFQAIQHMLADMDVDVHLMRTLLTTTAQAFEAGTASARDCSRVKLFCSEAAGRIADKAVQIHGGTGYCRGVTVERIYRDARVLRIYDGTSEIHRNIIAKDLLR